MSTQVASKIEWVERLIPGYPALALCAYVGGRLVAAIDQAYDDGGRHVHLVYLVTNPAKPAAICECRDDAQAIVERMIAIARMS
ncbi:MAG: hypothetical protein PVS2B1_17110 [Candidatus Dormibacteraceae bacterium]